MPKLKRCPFCKGKAEIKESDCCDGTFVIQCTRCDATIDQQSSQIEAADNWNRRKGPLL